MINGGGEDCLRAEGQCSIALNLGDRDPTLTNCERCIQAGGNVDVSLTTTGTLSCTASEDGILAQGTASVRLGGDQSEHCGGGARRARGGDRRGRPDGSGSGLYHHRH